MSRPMLLMFLLMILIITSQFEWRQQLVSDVDSNHNLAQKQQRISKREEAVKEKVCSIEGKRSGLVIPRFATVFEDRLYSRKIILSQEKSIQKLNELVRSLREELSECRSNNGSANSTLSNLTESIIDLERQQFLED